MRQSPSPRSWPRLGLSSVIPVWIAGKLRPVCAVFVTIQIRQVPRGRVRSARLRLSGCSAATSERSGMVDPPSPADKGSVAGLEVSECVSPELALVCPELRAAAIAALPERDPDAWLHRPPPTAPVYELLRALEREDACEQESSVPLVVAAAAYAAFSVTRFAVEGAALVGVVIGLLAVVVMFHP